jgi:hypothetical protein
MIERIPLGDYYTVQQGDGMSSIAARTGHFWPTIWNDPANAELKAVRREPEVLLPGDRVFIPLLRGKVELRATGKMHTFRRKGVPAHVRFRVQTATGQPFGARRFVLKVGDASYDGTTDAEGRLEAFVAPTADTGLLTLFNEDPLYPRELTWILRIGYLEPIETTPGVQARLTNLGFDCAGESGTAGPRTAAAVQAFRKRHGLAASGQIDDAFRNALREAYGY